MPDTPKPVRAYAAWHPKHGIDIYTIRDTPGATQRNMTAEQCLDKEYRIISVDIVPVKEEEK